MTEEEKKKKSQGISRREFLKDAGLVVGGAAIGSTVLLAACGGEGETATVTKTATTTATTTAAGGTATVTATVGEATKTVTETVSKFICPIDGTEFDTLTALQAHFAAAHPGEAVEVPGLVTLTINGDPYQIMVEPNWTLLDMLRGKLRMTAAKPSCEIGACGCCTVIMDGRPVVSCLVLAVEADNKVIETVEGLSAGEELHPIQQAFIDYHAIDCGYCTPGKIMSVKALLDKNSKPTKTEVLEAIAGNLCRCGSSYTNVAKAVLAMTGGG